MTASISQSQKHYFTEKKYSYSKYVHKIWDMLGYWWPDICGSANFLSKYLSVLVETVHWTVKPMCVSHISKNKEFQKLKMSALFTQAQKHYIGNILIKWRLKCSKNEKLEYATACNDSIFLKGNVHGRMQIIYQPDQTTPTVFSFKSKMVQLLCYAS